jgi:hypothetical protein
VTDAPVLTWQPADARTEYVLYVLEALWYSLRHGRPCPLHNTGARWSHRKLQVHAYSWSDDDQPYNLAWRDWRVRWYKYASRDTEHTRSLTHEEAVALLVDAATLWYDHDAAT